MARTINETFRQFLPGAGKDVLGNPAQGKTRVEGRINVTSYVSGGEALTPTDLGLTTINWINLRCQDEVVGPEVNQRRYASYSQTNDVFYLYQVGPTGVVNEYDLAETETVEYQATGDSSYDVELL